MRVISVALLIAAVTLGSALAARAAAPIFAAEWEVARGLQSGTLPAAPASGKSGLAILRVGIDATGKVVSAKSQFGDKDLLKVVEPALASWHYKSLEYEGKAIDLETYVSVVYSKEENLFFVQGSRCVVYGPPAAEFAVAGLNGGSKSANGVGRIDVPKDAASGADDLASKATDRPQPVYPPAALAKNITGDVTVEVVVAKSGLVVYAAPVSGNALLQGDSVRAARRWRFAPTTHADDQVGAIGRLTFHFPH